MSEIQQILKSLKEATTYWDVFGSSGTEDVKSFVDKKYRRLAHTTHPDKYKTEEEQELASEAFKLLGKFYIQAKRAIENGNYGEKPRLVVRTKKREYELLDLVVKGEVADLYTTVDTDNHTSSLISKVTRLPIDNELLQREAVALKTLKGDEEHYFPTLYDSFVYKDSRSVQRRVNILEKLNGWYTLEELRVLFPEGVSPLDMAWMYRRVLYALGYAHSKGLLHGAVLPSHILIHPDMHGVKLVDWCYSQKSVDESFSPLKVVSGKYLDWYPEEVLEKKSLTFGTDIYLVSKSMVYLLGSETVEGLNDSVPRAFRAYFRGCMQENQRVRPQDAYALLNEFDELLERLGRPYFPRVFRPFVISTT